MLNDSLLWSFVELLFRVLKFFREFWDICERGHV